MADDVWAALSNQTQLDAADIFDIMVNCLTIKEDAS